MKAVWVFFCFALLSTVWCETSGDSCDTIEKLRKYYPDLREYVEFNSKEVFKHVSSASELIERLDSRDGRKFVGNMITQVSIHLINGSTSNNEKQIKKEEDMFGVLEGLPENIRSLVTDHVQFIEVGIKRTLDYLKTLRRNKNVLETRFRDVYSVVHSAGRESHVDVNVSGRYLYDFIKAIHEIGLSGASDYFSDVMENIPEEPRSILKDYCRSSPSKKNDLITGYELVGCALHQSLSETWKAASMFWSFIFDRSLSDNGEEGRSLKSNTSREGIFSNIQAWPIHLFFETNLRKTSSPVSFMALVLQVNPRPKAEREARVLEESSIPVNARIKVDLMAGFSLLEWISQYIISPIMEFIQIAFENQFPGPHVFPELHGPPQTPVSLEPHGPPEVHSLPSLEGYLQHRKDSSRFLRTGRSLPGSQDKFKVHFDCFKNSFTTSSKALFFLDEQMRKCAYETNLSGEDILTILMEMLRDLGRRTDLAESLVKLIDAFVHKKETLESFRKHLDGYFTCIQKKKGPLRNINLRGSMTMEKLRDKTMDLMKEVKVVGQKWLKRARARYGDERAYFIESYVMDLIENIHEIWGIYQKTRSNPSCFIKKFCENFSSSLEKNEFMIFEKLFAFYLGMLQEIKTGDWSRTEDLYKILFERPLCEPIPDQKCEGDRVVNEALNLFRAFVAEY